MNNKIFTIVLIIIIGILLGGIVSKQAKDSLLRDLLTKQTEMLSTQKRIESKLTGSSAGNGDLSEILGKQQDLERRLSALENQWKGYQQVLKGPQAKGSPGQIPPQEDFSKVYTIDVAHSPVMGKKDAPVTIVEFVDFQCPFCARFHSPMVEAAKAYPNKVNYIIKNFPLSFHPNAKSAAKAAFAAGEQGKYAEMANALLANGKNLSEAKYEEIAKDIGLDVEKFLKDYKKKDAQWEDYIKKDMSLGSQVDVRGTPTFYINGRKTNARDVPSFKKKINKILESKNK